MNITFRNVILDESNKQTDVRFADGKVEAIGADVARQGDEIVDAGGRVLLPGFVETHIHLDKALIADRLPNKSGTLKEAIEVTGKLKSTFTADDVRTRATKALEMLIRNGSTYIRTHSEFDPSGGFTGFQEILALKQRYRQVVDMQVVAFPQEGILKLAGMTEMMEEAIRMGADVVGGIPYNDSSAEEQIDFVFKLGQKYDKDVDFHQDFKDDIAGQSIEYLCRKTIAEGYEGRVSVGHMTSIGAMNAEQLKPIAELMARAGINVMSLPATDLHLGGRNDDGIVRRALTPIRRLRDAGVNVVLGSNNIRNPFTPYGNGNPLQITALAIPVAHLGGAADIGTVLPMITDKAAKALRLPDYGLHVGGPATAILLDTFRYQDVVLDIPACLQVIKSGVRTVLLKKELDLLYRGML